MADKRRSKSVKSAKSKVLGVTRKTTRKTTAPYARRAGDDGDKSKSDDKDAPAAKEEGKDAKEPEPEAKDAEPEAKKPESEAKKPESEAKDVKPADEAKPEAKDAEPDVKPADEAEDAKPAEEVKPEAEEPRYAELVSEKSLAPKDPDSPAPPPGLAPPGDSRSFRRTKEDVDEFVLVYRDATYLITRAGVVGKEGTWTCKELPSQAAAARAYALECSELTGQGFYDLR